MPDKAHEVWKDVYTTFDESEAAIVSGLLESEGIPCRVESSRVSQFPVTVGKLGEVTVYVRMKDFELACKVLELAEKEQEEEA
jgi:hypothetical protein